MENFYITISQETFNNPGWPIFLIILGVGVALALLLSILIFQDVGTGDSGFFLTPLILVLFLGGLGALVTWGRVHSADTDEKTRLQVIELEKTFGNVDLSSSDFTGSYNGTYVQGSLVVQDDANTYLVVLNPTD